MNTHSVQGLNHYQNLAARTAAPLPNDDHAVNIGLLTLGLTGEAGEFADTIKKTVLQGHPLDSDALAKELGDVMWYVANIASALDRDLADIATQNIDKLRERYPDGFDTERSQVRP